VESGPPDQIFEKPHLDVTRAFLVQVTGN
jgi:hypothetical protein